MEKVLRIIVFIIAVLLLIFGAYLSYISKNAAAGLTYGSSIICLIFSFLPSFKRFKGLGIEAELEHKIKEADEVINYLRKISLPTAKLLFFNLSKLGWVHEPIPKMQQYRLSKEIEAGLSQIGIPKETIKDVKREWDNWNLIIMAKPLYEEVQKQLDNKWNKLTKELESIKQPISEGDKEVHNQLVNKRKLVENDRKHLSEIRKNASVESIVDNFLLFLDSSASLSDQERQLIKQNTKEIIEDIKYYSQTYDFRRPDEWFKNDDWEN